MRPFVDNYLTSLVHKSMNSIKQLTQTFVSDAEVFKNTIPTLLPRYENICKLLVNPDHVRTIISVDAEADAKSRVDRIEYLNSLKAETMCTAPDHRTALESILVSELLLATANLTLEQIIYHRARAFAYSLIFILKEELLPLLLLGNAGLEQTCQFALAAVILDDAEDIEEDLKAQSQTLFTKSTQEEALSISCKILAYLDSEKTRSNLSFLDTREFLLMAYIKLSEFFKSSQTPGLDTKKLLRRLAREHWSDTWRGI